MGVIETAPSTLHGKTIVCVGRFCVLNLSRQQKTHGLFKHDFFFLLTPDRMFGKKVTSIHRGASNCYTVFALHSEKSLAFLTTPNE